MKETDLYPPVKQYLESLGYSVMGEAAGCDIAAQHNNELIAVELKSAINLKLILQAVERQESCDSVYLAVPVSGSSTPPGLADKLRLVKRLELGLLLVRFLNHRTRVELVCHPQASTRRRNTRHRRAILQELAGRSGDYTPGGTNGTVVTAYREEALYIAWLLRDSNGRSPAECRRHGGSDKTGAILRDNHYDWFERVKRGVYRLTPAGQAALQEYAAVIAGWR